MIIPSDMSFVNTFCERNEFFSYQLVIVIINNAQKRTLTKVSVLFLFFKNIFENHLRILEIRIVGIAVININAHPIVFASDIINILKI